MFSGLYRKLLEEDRSYWEGAYGDIPKMLQLARLARQKLKLEYYGIPFSLSIEAELMGANVDCHAAGEPEITALPCFDLEDFFNQCNRRLQPAPISSAGVYPPPPFGGGQAPTLHTTALTEVISRLKSSEPQIPVIGSLTGPVTMLSRLLDSAQLFKAMAANPKLLHRALEEITPRSIDFGRRQIEAGADFLVLGEPSANSRILGPHHFAEFCSPYLTQIINSLGADHIILHICGQIEGILPEINKLPFGILSVEAGTGSTGIELSLPHNTVLKSICGNG